MDTGDILSKTAKGIEEIEKRTCRLDFRHRIALIQVDGQGAVEGLLPKIPGDGLALLEDLLRDGFVASADARQPPSPVAVPGASDAGTAPSTFDLHAAKQRSSETIESLLGPDGDSIAVAIERTRTFAEFSARAERTRDIIQQMKGATQAKKFWTATGL